MKENYSIGIANAINSYLKENDWNFSFNEESGMFKFGLSLSSKLKKIDYVISVQEDEYIVYAVAPIGADDDDEDMMANMAEFVCRANYGLWNGNFELDMNDGEVRFKYCVDCDGITPSEGIIKNSIHCPAKMFKRYGAGITDIIFGNISAKEAIEKCEKETDDELRSLLSELEDFEGDEELAELISKLSEHLSLSEDDDSEFSEADDVPSMIRTDLFGTQGGDE